MKMHELLTWFVEVDGGVQLSVSTVVVGLVVVSCATTLGGVLMNHRASLNSNGRDADLQDAEDQITWTELLRQLN